MPVSGTMKYPDFSSGGMATGGKGYPGLGEPSSKAGGYPGLTTSSGGAGGYPSFDQPSSSSGSSGYPSMG